jgi:hypothetical protein
MWQEEAAPPSSISWIARHEGDLGRLTAFRIRLYLDAEGLPGAIIAEEILSAAAVLVSECDRDPSCSSYRADVPASIFPAQGPFWLEVQALADGDGCWGVVSLPGSDFESDAALLAPERGIPRWTRSSALNTAGHDESPGSGSLIVQPDSRAGSFLLYPNPMVNEVMLDFDLAGPTRVQVVVTDASGRLVAPLADLMAARGAHHLRWDGTDNAGRRVPVGVYWVTLKAGRQRPRIQKLVLLPPD